MVSELLVYWVFYKTDGSSDSHRMVRLDPNLFTQLLILLFECLRLFEMV